MSGYGDPPLPNDVVERVRIQRAVQDAMLGYFAKDAADYEQMRRRVLEAELRRGRIRMATDPPSSAFFGHGIVEMLSR